jgi:G3E family GTPase
VIENEFGEVGVDHQLVIGAEEEIFEMNNGCICCTVRGDLIRILGQLLKRRDRFDYILIETTGMADPGPVAQTFFLDDDLAAVHARCASSPWSMRCTSRSTSTRSKEAREQIAFADVILLNKTDLVPADALERIERRVRASTPPRRSSAPGTPTCPVEKVLNVGAFDLDRALVSIRVSRAAVSVRMGGASTARARPL